MSPSESDLMKRFVEGDEGSFETIVDLYADQLGNFFYRLTRDRQAAEDLAQETFLRVVRSRERYTVRSSFRTFIFRIARNLWIDRYRSTRSRPRLVSMNAQAPGKDESETSLGDRLTSSSPQPSARIECEETRGLLAEAVVKLSRPQKEVFVLWLETGMKYAEISEILGIPVGTIKSRMHSAMHKLKDALRSHLQE